MKFDIKIDNNGMRRGKMVLPHFEVNTPVFMPVGTVGSVKGVSPKELVDMGAEIVLSNTYHLFLRPGEKLIKKAGGLHEFMRWDRAILTDSGGYQVFSLGGDKNKKGESLVKITNDGVEFKSHLDGSKHFFTPERVIDIQLDLGVDILMPLDVCPSGKASKKEIKKAVDLTIAWAKRARNYFVKRMGESKYKNMKEKPALFGIVQGGLDLKLRKECAEELIDLYFEGYAVGGLAVDLETRDMWNIVKYLGEILPEEKPRYLMGVGTPDDILMARERGMDMFDCVLPTRLGRHGSVFIKNKNPNRKIAKAERKNRFELINILNSKYREDFSVIEEGCGCPACSGGFSRVYISHLVRGKEILGVRLTSLHNLWVYLNLMK